MLLANLRRTLSHPERIESIDVMRGMAGLYVVLVHYNEVLPFLHQFSGLPTNLFLLLSGYLVSVPLTKEFLASERGIGVSFSQFFIKRFFKIIPSYYLFLLLGHGFVLWQVTPFAPDLAVQRQEWWEYVFFVRNYGSPPARAFEHIWSVCVEEHFYLVLPWLYIASSWRKNKRQTLLGLVLMVILLGIIFKLIAYFTQFAEHPNYTHNKMDVVAWGILLGVLVQSFPDFVKKHAGKWIYFWLGMGLMGVSLAFHEWFEPIFFKTFYLNSLSPFCYFLILWGILHQKMPAYLSIFRYIAYFNYNLYLWHYVFVVPFTAYLGAGYWGCFWYLLASLLTAIFFTWLVEEKMLPLRERVLVWWQRR
jgi:peptidoglycan/LPS O-acetylase OafA/YrhL